MDDKVAKELTKALKDNTKSVDKLVKLLRSQSTNEDEVVDPAQPEGTKKLRG